MPKPPRVLAAGAVYQVMTGSDRLEPLFLDDSDRLAWVTLMREARERFGCRFLAYGLTDGRIHLVIRTEQPNLPSVMEWLKRSYTRRFNARHGRHGRLFGSRYKARLVQEHALLPKLVRYIHRACDGSAYTSKDHYEAGKDDALIDTAPVKAQMADPAFLQAAIPPREWKKLDSGRNGILLNA